MPSNINHRTTAPHDNHSNNLNGHTTNLPNDKTAQDGNELPADPIKMETTGVESSCRSTRRRKR